jgi:hypothetical protein
MSVGAPSPHEPSVQKNGKYVIANRQLPITNHRSPITALVRLRPSVLVWSGRKNGRRAVKVLETKQHKPSIVLTRETKFNYENMFSLGTTLQNAGNTLQNFEISVQLLSIYKGNNYIGRHVTPQVLKGTDYNRG